MDSGSKLSRTTVVLHWIVALAIIGMIVLGEIIDDLPRSTGKTQLLQLHMSIGFAILVVAVLRVVWRIANGFPVPLGNMASWQRLGARLVHLALLAATVLMPVSGLVAVMAHGTAVDVFGLFSIPALVPTSHTLHEVMGFAHRAGAKLLILAVALHVAAALKHHYIDRDDTLARMLGRRSGAG